MDGISMKRKELSLHLCSASMLAYCVWLLLPAMQTLGGALAGAATVALFAAGILLDGDEWRKNGLLLILQAGCAVTLPLILFFFMQRGGGNLMGFFAANVMLWYPLIFASYALRKKEKRLVRYLKILLLGLLLVTALTTTGWTLYGMLVEKVERTYPRLLGTSATDPELSKLLMLRNIGGYDFIYAAVLALPLLCLGFARSAGVKRLGYFGFIGLVLMMVVLSQYTYAMVYAAMILVVEIFAGLARKIFRTTPGRAMLIGLVPLVVIALLSVPLLSLGMQIADKLNLTVVGNNLERLRNMLTGDQIASGDRLGYYTVAWNGFMASPALGSLPGGEKMLSQHSELLDMLSGVGIIGTAVVIAMIWLMHKGLWKAAKKSEAFPHLVLMGAALLMLSSFGTSFYSRDVWLIYAMALLLTKKEEISPCPGPGEGSTDILPTEGEG